MATKIKSIKKIKGLVEQQCIHVNSDDGLYITDDHIVTHNSALTMQGGVNYKTVAGDKDIIGSSQPLDSDIYLPDGTTKKMGDLRVGDVIASPTEGSQTVLHIFPKPKIRCWKITLSDGRTVRCAADHMWKIAWQKKPNGKWDWQVKPFQFILDHPELKFEIWDKDNCDDIPYIWDENTK